MTEANRHALNIDTAKCIGCVHCLTACPTRAIRVTDGKARIIDELCIDCGECLRFCPRDAIEARTTSFADLKSFRFKVAIPATVLYGQFDNATLPNAILFALRRIGLRLRLRAQHDLRAQQLPPSPSTSTTIPRPGRSSPRPVPSSSASSSAAIRRSASSSFPSSRRGRSPPRS